MLIDCDQDTILLKVKQEGVPCHTGNSTCFYEEIYRNDHRQNVSNDTIDSRVLDELYNLVLNRKNNPTTDSYTSHLFEKGIDEILKKVGEEAVEVIIAAKNSKENDELIYETADLFYHLIVMLVERNLSIEDILIELKRRRK